MDMQHETSTLKCHDGSGDAMVNILLVDDQPGKLLTYETMLGDLGENLIRASSAREALEYLLKTDIAVILVDACMPDMDGFELAAMIRQHPRFQTTAIILVSAVLNNDVDRLRGYDCGAMDFVPVPVVPEILRAKVSVFADLYRKTRQLERINEMLEVRVAERTADLEEALKKYRHSEEKLQEADRRKDEFLAVLSHELRNPLAGIVGGIQVLNELGTDSADAVEMRQIVARQASLMQRLLDDLLDVTRIARGKIVLRTEPVDLVALVRGVVHDQAREFAAVGRTLTAELTSEPAVCRGDSVRLTQVLVNVLHNALKFTDEGGSTHLALRVDSGSAIVTVEDTGIGMDNETLSLAFEPFAQADQSLARNRGGLGLGLALAKRLVEKHGGQIVATSQGVGLGTKMTITLPLTSDTCAVSRTTHPRPPDDGRYRVLIIDDRRDAVHPLVKLLQLKGHEVEVAGDGPQGLEVAHWFQPHVVLCDIGLPGMDGYEVARRFRSAPAQAGVCLAAITGYGQEADRCRALEAGFDLHLTKPVGTAEVDRLLDYLAGQHLAKS
jgi:signal transduction histidine kinase